MNRPGLSRFFKNLCCCLCCKDPDTTFKGSVLKIENAPSPDTIQWQNLYTPGAEQLIRRMVSIIICIGFLLGSFILIVYIRNVKDNALEKYPKVDCSLEKFNVITEEQVIAESQLSDQETQVGYISCFCKRNWK